jgi:hypothetical protein
MHNPFSLSSLTLIVEREIVKLEGILPDVPENWQVLSIGGELSAFLVVSSEVDRSKVSRDWLLEELRKKSPGPVICKDIDLLFHPSLNLDPLVLFRQASRHTKLVVLWPGSYNNGVLSYAVPEHNHYHLWKNLEGIEVKGVNDAL